MSEGKVARARTQAIKTLNSKAKSIAGFLDKNGKESDIIEASDSIDSFARVEAQFGMNEHFDRSQVVSITIHDVDDYVVELPAVLSMVTGAGNYAKLKGLRATKSHLNDIINKLVNVYSKFKSKQ